MHRGLRRLRGWSRVSGEDVWVGDGMCALWDMAIAVVEEA